MGGIPNPMNVNTKVSGSFGSIGPVSVSGIPDTFHINVDALPKIQVGLDEIRMHSTIDPLDVKATVSIDRIPDIRAHLPADLLRPAERRTAPAPSAAGEILRALPRR